MSELLEAVERGISPLLASAGVELVHLSYGKSPSGWTLSVFIDKQGGVTLDDCSTWSHKIGQYIDENNLISHAYSLEVASPGIDRPLHKLKDFQRFVGERITMKLFAPIEGQRNFQGILVDAPNENEIKIRTEEGRDVVVSMDRIAKAKLNPEIRVSD